MTKTPIVDRIHSKVRAWKRDPSHDGKYPRRLILGRKDLRELRAAAMEPTKPASISKDPVYKQGKSTMVGLAVTCSKRSRYLSVQ